MKELHSYYLIYNIKYEVFTSLNNTTSLYISLRSSGERLRTRHGAQFTIALIQ